MTRVERTVLETSVERNLNGAQQPGRRRLQRVLTGVFPGHGQDAPERQRGAKHRHDRQGRARSGSEAFFQASDEAICFSYDFSAPPQIHLEVCKVVGWP